MSVLVSQLVLSSSFGRGVDSAVVLDQHLGDSMSQVG